MYRCVTPHPVTPHLAEDGTLLAGLGFLYSARQHLLAEVLLGRVQRHALTYTANIEVHYYVMRGCRYIV